MSVFSDLLNGVLTIDPSAEVIDYQGRWYSWRQLGDTIAEIRTLLATLGRGERTLASALW